VEVQRSGGGEVRHLKSRDGVFRNPRTGEKNKTRMRDSSTNTAAFDSDASESEEEEEQVSTLLLLLLLLLLLVWLLLLLLLLLLLVLIEEEEEQLIYALSAEAIEDMSIVQLKTQLQLRGLLQGGGNATGNCVQFNMTSDSLASRASVDSSQGGQGGMLAVLLEAAAQERAAAAEEERLARVETISFGQASDLFDTSRGTFSVLAPLINSQTERGAMSVSMPRSRGTAGQLIEGEMTADERIEAAERSSLGL